MRFAGQVRGTYVDTGYLAYAFESVSPSPQQSIAVYLLTEQASTLEEWQSDLDSVVGSSDASGNAGVRQLLRVVAGVLGAELHPHQA